MTATMMAEHMISLLPGYVNRYTAPSNLRTVSAISIRDNNSMFSRLMRTAIYGTATMEKKTLQLSKCNIDSVLLILSGAIVRTCLIPYMPTVSINKITHTPMPIWRIKL